MIDLHTHTNASDGTLTPEELIQYAIEKKLSAIAITDHDTIDGVITAKKYLDKMALSELELISGIELSTACDLCDAELHVLGLYIDPADSSFTNRLQTFIDERYNRNLKMIDQLARLNMPITMEELLGKASDAIITRAHFARVLWEKGYVTSMEEAFSKWLGFGKPAYIEREKLNTYTAIEMINKNGGIPILAHPTLYGLNKEDLENLIQALVKQGLKGIEGIYSLYSEEETIFIQELAKKYDLITSGGSDYHGSNKKRIDLGSGLGNLSIPDHILDGLKNY